MNAFQIERQNVGPGWQPLLEQLDRDIKAIAPEYEVSQIKEKFGGLRFYVGFVPEGVHELINRAENESFLICEECGVPSVPQTTKNGGYWLRSLCAEHRAMRPQAAQ